MSVKFLRRFVLLAALVAVVGVGLYYVREKTYLRVASGPERSELYRIVGAFQQALTEDGNRLRVRRVCEEHLGVLDAIAAGNRDEAARRLAAHLSEAADEKTATDHSTAGKEPT